MSRRVTTLACLLLGIASCVGAQTLVGLVLPRLGPADDYTYAVCPSAALADDGSLWLAATVGRLISGDWSGGYEQVRLYHYTESGVSGEVVVDNRTDGAGGLFEECQLSLVFVDGHPLIAGTATLVPPDGAPEDRFGVVGTWYEQPDGQWAQYMPIVGHSWPAGYEPEWSSRWLGDPILLQSERAGLRLYWSERTGTEWCQWMGTPRWPGAPVVTTFSVGIYPPDAYFADLAWISQQEGRLIGIVDYRDQPGPPWDIARSLAEYPLAVFSGPTDTWGPSGVWGRNPSLIRDPNGGMADSGSLLFESTADLAEPQNVLSGDPVVYRLWLWDSGAVELPATVYSSPRFATERSVRSVEVAQR